MEKGFHFRVPKIRRTKCRSAGWSSDVYEKCLVHVHDAQRPRAHKADMKKSGSEMSISGEEATFNIVIYAYLPGFYSHNLFGKYKNSGTYARMEVPRHMKNFWTTLAPVPLYHWPNMSEAVLVDGVVAIYVNGYEEVHREGREEDLLKLKSYFK